jgi:hypothetical protein
MKVIYPPFILLFLIACSNSSKEIKPALNHASAVIPNAINYDSCKKSIYLIKQKSKTSWNKLPVPEKEKMFTAAVAETIIPVWIGTAWDFNGTTEIPRHGNIACGYFVTTVLRDAGLPLARIKLAQCASEKMLTALIQPKYIQRFSNVPIGNFIKAVEANGYGLYIVGLDNHTGFIYNDGAAVYFIHSTFVGTRNVQKEKAIDSWVLAQSKYKVLGKISADEKILNRWMD